MEPQPGWGPAAVTRFLCSGRDWEAVRSYCRNVVTGDATIGSLGLQLLAAPPPMPPPPPAATGASSTAGLAASAAQPAEHSDQQPSDGGKGGQQSETEERPLASAAAQRRRLPFARTTFLVCLSYYGPAFRCTNYYVVTELPLCCMLLWVRIGIPAGLTLPPSLPHSLPSSPSFLVSAAGST